MGFRRYELGSYEEMCAAHSWDVPGALQHRPRRLRQARPRPAGDGLGGLARAGAARHVRRAAGHVEPLRERARGGRGGARRSRRDAAALAARDRGGLPRHLQARRDPAVDVGALRRRGHPAPAARLAGEGRRHRRRQPPPHPRGDGRAGGGDGRPRGGRRRRLRRGDGERLRSLRDGRHRRRRPGAALLLVGHDRAGEGHPARAPLPARARGVRVLPRRARRRAVPRVGRVGLGGRDLPAAGPVALRRRGAGAGAQGRLRPRGAPGVPVQARGAEHVHDADGAAVDDRGGGRGHALSAEGAAHHLLGRRAAQPRGDPLVSRAIRDHGARLLRADRELSAVRELPDGRGARGLDGTAAAGLGGGDPRRGRAAARRGRARRDLPQGALEPALPDRLLEPARGQRGGLRRGLVPHQGRGRDGRGRIRLVRRPRRRRDHLGGLPDRPVRGRVGVRGAPGRAGGGRGGVAGPAPRRRREGVHRARVGPLAVRSSSPQRSRRTCASATRPTPTRARSSSSTTSRRRSPARSGGSSCASRSASASRPRHRGEPRHPLRQPLQRPLGAADAVERGGGRAPGGRAVLADHGPRRRPAARDAAGRRLRARRRPLRHRHGRAEGAQPPAQRQGRRDHRRERVELGDRRRRRGHGRPGLRQRRAAAHRRRLRGEVRRVWHFDVGDGFFLGQGEDPGAVFRVEPSKVLAFAKDPHGQTSFRFG